MQARSTTTRHWPHHQEVPQPLLLHGQGAPSLTVRFRSARAIDGALVAQRSSAHRNGLVPFLAEEAEV